MTCTATNVGVALAIKSESDAAGGNTANMCKMLNIAVSFYFKDDR